MRDERQRISDFYDPKIDELAKECDAACRVEQDAWDSGDMATARAAIRAYDKSVRILHAYMLKKSIDLGFTKERPEDAELLNLIK